LEFAKLLELLKLVPKKVVMLTLVPEIKLEAMTEELLQTVPEA
jgi:hypothetical protein